MGPWVKPNSHNLMIRSIVETIITQEQQIVNLVDTLEKTNSEFKKSQKELLAWATQAIAHLNAKNELLFENLLDAKSKIKNFSYNIQVMYLSPILPPDIYLSIGF